MKRIKNILLAFITEGTTTWWSLAVSRGWLRRLHTCLISCYATIEGLQSFSSEAECALTKDPDGGSENIPALLSHRCSFSLPWRSDRRWPLCQAAYCRMAVPLVISYHDIEIRYNVTRLFSGIYQNSRVVSRGSRAHLWDGDDCGVGPSWL